MRYPIVALPSDLGNILTTAGGKPDCWNSGSKFPDLTQWDRTRLDIVSEGYMLVVAVTYPVQTIELELDVDPNQKSCPVARMCLPLTLAAGMPPWRQST